MLISTGFLTSLLLLVAPSAESLVVAVAATAMLLGSDWLGLDSRRASDVAGERMLRENREVTAASNRG